MVGDYFFVFFGSQYTKLEHIRSFAHVLRCFFSNLVGPGPQLGGKGHKFDPQSVTRRYIASDFHIGTFDPHPTIGGGYVEQIPRKGRFWTENLTEAILFSRFVKDIDGRWCNASFGAEFGIFGPSTPFSGNLGGKTLEFCHTSVGDYFFSIFRNSEEVFERTSTSPPFLGPNEHNWALPLMGGGGIEPHESKLGAHGEFGAVFVDKVAQTPSSAWGGGYIVAHNPQNRSFSDHLGIGGPFGTQTSRLINLGTFSHILDPQKSLLGLSMAMEGKLGIFSEFLSTWSHGDYFLVFSDAFERLCGYIQDFWSLLGCFESKDTPPSIGLVILPSFEPDFDPRVKKTANFRNLPTLISTPTRGGGLSTTVPPSTLMGFNWTISALIGHKARSYPILAVF